MPTSKLNFSKRIIESTPLQGMRLFTLKTDIEDVVYITGSFLGGAVFSPDNPVVPDLVTVLLEEGTKKQRKELIREKLESVGASVDFDSDTYRIRFIIQCLKKDLPLALELLAEQLREPAFGADDFAKVKKRALGALEQAKEEPKNHASQLLLQTLYPKNHPNYVFDFKQTEKFLHHTELTLLKRYYEQNFALGSFNIVAVGDIDPNILPELTRKNFTGWRESSPSIPPLIQRAHKSTVTSKIKKLQDKTSADIYFGQAVGINLAHPDYYPLMLAFRVLGSGFSSRLMSKVRDKDGLTYGIAAGLGGATDGADGYWWIWGTFAPYLIERGIEITRQEIEKFKEEGIGQHELSLKQSYTVGTYLIDLETTQGLGGVILFNAEQNRPKEFIDQFPDMIKNITLEQVNQAIRRYVEYDKIATIVAGSIDRKLKPLS